VWVLVATEVEVKSMVLICNTAPETESVALVPATELLA